MKRLFLVLLLLTSVAASGEVARLAPNFALDGAGKTATLRSLQGKPVVLIVAKNAREGDVRAQVKKLKELYQEFASRQVIFIAAFQEGAGDVRSDIPFVIAKDGAKVAADYGVNGPFNFIIIGKDGNVDLQSSKVCPAARVRDVVINSYAVQAAARK
jgi:hypothetical protein